MQLYCMTQDVSVMTEEQQLALAVQMSMAGGAQDEGVIGMESSTSQVHSLHIPEDFKFLE